MAEQEPGKEEGAEPGVVAPPEPKIELPPPVPPPKVMLSPELLSKCLSQIGKTFDGLSYAYTQLIAEVCYTNNMDRAKKLKSLAIIFVRLKT